MRRGSYRNGSGDNVGDQLILDLSDLVTQLQLSLLQPCELELVDRPALAKRDDRRVEITMLDAKQVQPRQQPQIVQATNPRFYRIGGIGGTRPRRNFRSIARAAAFAVSYESARDFLPRLWFTPPFH